MAFVPVAKVAEIPAGQGVYVEHEGLPLAVFHGPDGRFHATGPTCPHEDGPLAEGWIEGGAVVCPWHGFDFDLGTGRCRVDEDLSVPVYPVRIIDGVVEVDLP